MAAQVEIEGLEELRRRLGELGKEIRQAAEHAVAEAADAVRDDAREQVRVDTGALRNGVKVFLHRADLSAEVGWRDPDLHYATFQEFGTSRIPANPALTAAAEAERRRFPKRVTADVRKAIG